MKIQRFVAKDSRQALRVVREAMGGDAVILSSQRVDGGVEVVAAADYDERLLNPAQTSSSASQPAARSVTSTRPAVEARPARQADYGASSHSVASGYVAHNSASVPNASATAETPESVARKAEPQADKESYNEMRRELTNLRSMLEGELTQLSWREMGQGQPLRAALVSRLGGMGLGRDICLKLTDQVKMSGDKAADWQAALGELSNSIVENNDDILNHGGRVAVVGPTGVGKTTSVAKLAARFAMRHGRKQVALITTDCYRIGGQEQIYTFGRILGVPVRVATNRDELIQALGEFADRKLVLIDTAGMSQRDMGLTQQFDTLQGVEPGIKIFLTLSATSQLAILDEVVRKFGTTNLAGAIITKVDETASMGPILTALVRHKLSVAYVGNGQRVPEDIHPARAPELVKHAEDMMETVGWDQPVLPTNDFGGMTLNAGIA